MTPSNSNYTISNESGIIRSRDISYINFSSPHAFLFTDGTTVPPVSMERSKALELLPESETHAYREAVAMGEANRSPLARLGIENDPTPTFELTDAIYSELERIASEVQQSDDIVLVIIPLLMRLTIEREGPDSIPPLPKNMFLVTVSLADRQKKICHSKKFGFVEETRILGPGYDGSGDDWHGEE